MTEYLIQDSTLTNLANVVRNAVGITEKMGLDSMIEAIDEFANPETVTITFPASGAGCNIYYVNSHSVPSSIEISYNQKTVLEVVKDSVVCVDGSTSFTDDCFILPENTVYNRYYTLIHTGGMIVHDSFEIGYSDDAPA